MVIGPYSLSEVKTFLPHREPFLFVDSISQIVIPHEITTEDIIQQNFKKLLQGIVEGNFKTPTQSHPIFKGHFPGNPILPGVIQLEIMAQVCSFCVVALLPDHKAPAGLEVALISFDSVKFRRPISTETLLSVKGECIAARRPIITFNAELFSPDGLCAQAKISASVKLNPKT